MGAAIARCSSAEPDHTPPAQSSSARRETACLALRGLAVLLARLAPCRQCRLLGLYLPLDQARLMLARLVLLALLDQPDLARPVAPVQSMRRQPVLVHLVAPARLRLALYHLADRRVLLALYRQCLPLDLCRQCLPLDLYHL